MNRFVDLFTCHQSAWVLTVCILIMLSNSDGVVGQFEPVVLLPLGQYPFLSSFVVAPSSGSSSTVPAPSDDNPALTRKLADITNPAETAFINTCKGYVGNAALNCPCAAPGRRCADAASLCTNSKCVCDPALGYLDSTGKKCIRYATTTTAAPATCAPCTCPTTTTTAPTTTTTVATTTAAPDRRCGTGGISANIPDDGFLDCTFMNKGDAYKIAVGTDDSLGDIFLDNYSFLCPGASFQVDVDFVFPDIADCNLALMNIYATTLCTKNTPSRINVAAPFFAVAVFVASTAPATGGYSFTVTCV